MRKPGPIGSFILLAAIGAALASWAIIEGRLQREETANALALEAERLAGTLAPALSSAAAATRELDELVTWRLLDNARLIAMLYDAGALDQATLTDIVDRHELDSVVVRDVAGSTLIAAGDRIPDELFERLDDTAIAVAEDVILGSTTEAGVEHIAVAAATADGGAIVVRIHAADGRTFARRLGVENLLTGLVDSQGVLYLEFSEDPADVRHAVSWDGGALPPPLSGGARLREVRGRPVYEVIVPVLAPAGTTAQLRVGLDGAPLVRSAISASRRTVLIGLVLAGFSLAMIGLALLARWRTVERAEAERRVAEADAARQRSERLAAAGALTAGMAHEVRGPLNAIVVAAQRIERKHPDGACNEFAGTIRAEARRLDGTLHQFLELAQPVSNERTPCDLRTVAEEVRELLIPEADEMGLTLVASTGGGHAIVDRESVRRALINLVHNAMQSSPPGGAIELVVTAADGYASIQVSDRGPGVDEEDVERLFDAFVTSRADGTGLGLALVRRVAEEHGGSCELGNRTGGGAVATLRLSAEGVDREPDGANPGRRR